MIGDSTAKTPVPAAPVVPNEPLTAPQPVPAKPVSFEDAVAFGDNALKKKDPVEIERALTQVVAMLKDRIARRKSVDERDSGLAVKQAIQRRRQLGFVPKDEQPKS